MKPSASQQELFAGSELGKTEDNPTWSPKEEKALVRKLDWRVIPLVSCMYFLAYLDRVNIGNAKVANSGNDMMEVSLGLKGMQYNWAVAVFFIPYCIFEVPSNFMMRIAGPKVWLARIMVTWGIISTCQAFASNFTGLMVCRTLLGTAEAGLFPGVIYFFTFWYRKHEISTRVSILFSFNSIASSFSGLLATGLAQMNGIGGLKGWQWIMVLEGAPSVILGVICFFILPNFPQNSPFFLSPREEEIAVRRLPTTAPSITEKSFDWDECKRSLKDPVLILFVFGSFFLVLPSYGTSYFRPSIISGLGYTGDMANLMSAWPGVLTAIVDQVWGWHSDKVKERPMHIIAAVLVGAVGNALLLAGQSLLWAPWLRYLFLFISALSGPGIPILYVYRSTTIKGTTAQAVAMGLTIAVGNVGGFLAPFVYPNTWAPLYVNAIWISFVLQLGCGLCVFGIWRYEVYKIRTDPEWATEIASGAETSVGSAMAHDVQDENKVIY